MTQLTPDDAGWYLFTRTAAWNIVQNAAAAALGWGITSYRVPTRVGAMRAVRELKRRGNAKMTRLEAIQLCLLVRTTARLGGCMAELGVYQGA
jgi:hypothetical protein